MRIKPITRNVKAKALTNPFPSYVSLVKAGANQRPIRAIKMDGFASEENSDMKIQRADAKIAALITTGYDLVSLSFAKDTFADTAAVKAWLDDGGYSDYEIVDTKKGFEVVNGSARVETGTARKVQADTGVSAFIAKSHVEHEAAPAADTSVVEDIAAAGTSATKADDKPKDEANLGDILLAAPAHVDVIDTDEELAAQRALADSGMSAEDFAKLSDDVQAESVAKALEAIVAERAAAVQPVADVVADDADAVEKGHKAKPGHAHDDEEMDADGKPKKKPGTPKKKGEGEAELPVAEVPNTDADLIERADAVVAALVAQGVEVSTTKGACFYAVAGIADVIQTMRYLIGDADWNGLDDATVELLKNSARTALTAFVAASGTVAAEYAEALKSAAPAVDEVVTEPVAPVGIDMAAIAKMIGEAVTNAIAPVSEAVAGVTTQVEALSTSTKADRDDLTQRVEALSQRGQARKGADIPVTNVDTPSTDTKQPVQASRGMLAAMGSRHARD